MTYTNPRPLPTGFAILEITTVNLTSAERTVEYVWQREPTALRLSNDPQAKPTRGNVRWARRIQAELDAELEENPGELESWMIAEMRAALYDLPSDEELAKPLEPEPPMPESQRVVPAGHVHGDVTGKAREVMDVITAWMLDNRMRVDQNEHYYSGKAWDARREQWGGGAELVVTHDGGDLYDVLAANYGHRLCDKFEAHLTAELTRLGLRFERITSWATGIYKD